MRVLRLIKAPGTGTYMDGWMDGMAWAFVSPSMPQPSPAGCRQTCTALYHVHDGCCWVSWQGAQDHPNTLPWARAKPA